MSCYSIRKQVAVMIVALEGLDLLVFTGGIGEHMTSVGRDLQWHLLARCQPRSGTKSIVGRSHQRSDLTLFRPCAPLARRRTDRRPYVGTRLGYFVI